MEAKAEVTCELCKKPPTSPIQLPCNCTLCRSCADHMMSQLENKPTDDRPEGEFSSASSELVPEDIPTGIPCKEAVSSDGQGLDGLGENSQLLVTENRYEELTSNGEEEQVQLACQLCEEDPPRTATKTCTVCTVRYCEQCLVLTHPQRAPFNKHVLVSPRDSFDKPVLCPDHPTKPVELYCVQDQTLVCLLCEKVGRHQHHNMAALQDVFSRRRADLQSQVDRLGAWIDQREDKVQKLKDKQENVDASVAELKSRIKRECDDLIDRIGKRHTEMDRQVTTISNGDTSNLARMIRDIQDNVPRARASLSKAKDVLEETDHARFLQQSPSVMAEIHRMFPIFGVNTEEVACAIDRLTVDFSQQKQMLETMNISERYVQAVYPSPHGFYGAVNPFVQHAPFTTPGYPHTHPPVSTFPSFAPEPTAQIVHRPPIRHPAPYKNAQPTSQGQHPPAQPPILYGSKSMVEASQGRGYLQPVTACPPHSVAPSSGRHPPAQPTILHDLCSTSMVEAYISWQAVHGADTYEVRYAQGDTLTAGIVQHCSFTATHLTPATKYRFEIRAQNAVGSSQASVVELTTLGHGYKFKLNPKTAGRFLKFSRLNTRVTVTEQEMSTKRGASPAHFTDGNTVLGDKPIAGGRHYWEVGGTSSHWAVGVAYGTMPRDRDIRDTTKSWAFVQHEKTQTLQHNEETIFRTQVDKAPSKIGVMVDYDADYLSLYNADTGTVIYTHQTTFTDPVYPAFSLWQGALQIYTGLEKHQEPLTAAMLAELPPTEQKQALGERLFPLVEFHHPQLAGKITGMLLEIDNAELLHMLESRESLTAKMEEAVAVLQAHQAKEAKAKSQKSHEKEQK